PAPKVRVRKTYDFSWPEEIGMALAFAISLYAFRGLYGQVPFLCAIGLAVTATIAAMMVWRLATVRDLTFQRWSLRAGGRLTRAGVATLVLALALVALTGHSVLIQYHALEGERLLLAAQQQPRGARDPLLDESLRHLGVADRLGLFGDGALE